MPESTPKICRNCQHAFIGKEKGDKEMAMHKYRSCLVAVNPIERARYVSVDTKCVYPDRFMAKEEK